MLAPDFDFSYFREIGCRVLRKGLRGGATISPPRQSRRRGAPDLTLAMLGRQHVAGVSHAERLEDALLGEALDRRTAYPSQ